MQEWRGEESSAVPPHCGGQAPGTCLAPEPGAGTCRGAGAPTRSGGQGQCPQGDPARPTTPRAWGGPVSRGSSPQRVKDLASTGHSAISWILNLPQQHKTNSPWCQRRNRRRGRGSRSMVRSYRSRLPGHIPTGATHPGSPLKGAARAPDRSPAAAAGHLGRLRGGGYRGAAEPMWDLQAAGRCLRAWPLTTFFPMNDPACFGAYQADLCSLLCLENGLTLKLPAQGDGCEPRAGRLGMPRAGWGCRCPPLPGTGSQIPPAAEEGSPSSVGWSEVLTGAGRVSTDPALSSLPHDPFGPSRGLRRGSPGCPGAASDLLSGDSRRRGREALARCGAA